MNREENIKHGLKLFQIRSKLQEMGIVQPIKEMIERGLWKANKNNHNYLSGRMYDNEFLKALDKLENQCQNV